MKNMKTIDYLKRRIHDLQLTDRSNRTAARPPKPNYPHPKAARANSAKNFDHSIADLTAWRKALTRQGNILHQHLENVSPQATHICQVAVAAAAGPAEGSGGNTRVRHRREIV